MKRMSDTAIRYQSQHHKLKNFYHGVLLSCGQLGVTRRNKILAS